MALWWGEVAVKAVFVISTLGTGGAERAMSELASFLDGRGWQMVLATYEGTEAVDFYPVSPGVRRVRLGNPPAASTLLGKLKANRQRVAALRALLHAEEPEVALSFMDTSNVLCLLAASGMDLPVVVAERTDPSANHTVPIMWRLGRWLLYRRAAMVVAQTCQAAKWLSRHCSCVVDVIPNALRNLPTPPEAREPVVVSAGRLDPVKGFDMVLRAFSKNADAFPGWRLVIAGDGPQRDTLKRLASGLGIQDRVDWLGQRRDIEQIFGKAAVVAQGSRFEGFPNVILEAMGMGAAVISTDCRSGPREIIEHGKSGFLVPVDDVKSLTVRLYELMSSEALRQRLGKAAMEVRVRFAQETVLGQWEKLILRVCDPERNQ